MHAPFWLWYICILHAHWIHLDYTVLSIGFMKLSWIITLELSLLKFCYFPDLLLFFFPKSFLLFVSFWRSILCILGFKFTKYPGIPDHPVSICHESLFFQGFSTISRFCYCSCCLVLFQLDRYSPYCTIFFSWLLVLCREVFLICRRFNLWQDMYSQV